MRKFLKWLLIFIVSLLAIFIIGGWLIPRNWEVTESITINASKEAIYNQIANLKNWQNWSAWTKEKDPTQVYTYEGPEIGEGAKWLWTSEKMGTGWLLVNKANEETGMGYELFIDMGDMQSTIYGDISYTNKEDGQHVVWVDRGDSENNLIKRWMSLLVKKMLSQEMQDGLTKLKSLVETKQE